MSNEYDAAVTASLQPDTAQAARVGFLAATDTNPDAYAEAKRVAARTGVPVDTVFAMPAEIKRQDAVGSIDFDALAKTSPSTAALLSDVEKAKVAHDDVGTLSKLEAGLYSLGKFEVGTAKAVASSVAKFNEGAWGLLRAGGDLLPGAIGDPISNFAAEQGGYSRYNANRMMPKADNLLESSWYSGMQSLGLNLLQLPLGIGGKMAPLLTAMGLNTGGQAYGEARDKGVSVPQSLAFGASQGVVEAGTEMIGMPALFGMLKPGQFGTKALEYLIKEQGGEQIATHLQDLNEWATLNPEKTFKDYLDARPAAAVQTALATAFGGGGQVAIMKGVELYMNRGREAQQASQMGELLTGLNQLAEASHLVQRDTETAQGFFQSVLEDGRDAVYITPDALAQSGLAEKMAQAIPAVAEQLGTAAETGHDIRIPIADLMATMAGPELEQSLLPNVAIEPGGFTPTTAQEYLQSDHAKELQAEVERVLGEHHEDGAFKASAQVVKNTIKEQLATAGRFTESVNDAYSSMVGNFYAVQAARMGATPEAMFAKYPLRIGAESVAGQRFDQSGPFGPVLTEHKGDAQGAIAKLKEMKTGEAIGALHHPEIGDIDLVWGEEGKNEHDGYGLAKLVRWHPEVLEDLQGVVSSMKVVKRSENRAMLESDDHKGGVRLQWDGVRKHWLLTAFRKDEAKGGDVPRTDTNIEKQVDDSLPAHPSDEIVDQKINEFHQAAYHGSPYHFDKFSLEHMGKGEGAQAYGWGIYFAGNKEVAEYYRGALSDLELRVDGGEFDNENPAHRAAADKYEAEKNGWNMQDVIDRIKRSIEDLESRGKEWADQEAAKQRETVELLESGKKLPKYEEVSAGQLYKVEIPDSEYLLWDKPLSEQPEDVKRALRDAGIFDDSGEAEERFADSYAAAVNELGGNAQAVKQAILNLVRNREMTDADWNTLLRDNPQPEGFDLNDIHDDYRPKYWVNYYNHTTGTHEAHPAGMTGESAYRELTREMNGGAWSDPQEAASRYLNSLGIAGIKYLDGSSRADGEGSYNYVVFDDNAIKILNTYYQNQQAPRGSFNPASLQITLLKNADLSTFLHESGHFFLEVQADLAGRLQQEASIHGADTLKPGEQQVLKDMQAMLDWFGIKDLAEWNNLDFEEKRSYHEKFARGFEAYLFEGKAPSIDLQGLFQRFRAWLLNVYRDLKALNVELTDEVRGVFDRMLATNEQITLAEQGRSMMPLFTSPEQIGMTPAEFADYQALGVDATNEAIEDLQARGLRDMQWIHNARGRIIKKLQKESAAKRAEVQMEVRAEVMRQPIYQAWQFLTGRIAKDDKLAREVPTKSHPDIVDPAQDSLFAAIAKLGGIDKSELIKTWGIDPADKAQSGVFGKHVMRAEGKGLSIDGMAEELSQHGYLPLDEHGKWDLHDFEERFKSELGGSPEYSTAFDYSLRQAPGRAGEEVINPSAVTAGRLDRASLAELHLPSEITDHLETLRMVAKEGWHPDLVAEMFGFSSGDELVRRLAAAESPKAEIEALTDQRMLEQFGDLSSQEAITKAADKAIHNDVRARMIATELNALARATGQRQTLASAAKEYAAAMISRLKVRDIKPGQYASAEVRASKAAEQASKSGDLAKAAAEKRNQLINAYATRAAYDAQEEVEKGLRYLKTFDSAGKRKGLDADYTDQIDALLERFDLRAGQSFKSIDKRVALAEWITKQRDAGLEPDVPPALVNEAFRTSYKNLTVEELRGLIDTVKQIEHLGRLKHKLLTARDQRAYEAVRDEIAASIEQHADGRQAQTRTPDTVLGKSLQKMRNFWAAHIKAAMWSRIMDGGKDGGPMWEYFIRAANERGDQETTMRAEATARLSEILAPLFDAGKMTTKTFFPSIGRSLTREGRLAIALNVGNQGNLQRLQGGEGWTDAQLAPILRTLTAQEWTAVQAIWDHFESYRPQIAAKERRIYGKEPEWVTPTPFTVQTADGQTVQMRGGYYPVKYDPAASQRAEEHADAEGAKRQLQGAYTTATTRRSFTKARAEEVNGRPLLYSLAGVYSGVNDVIHDLAWHEWLIDTNRLLRSQTIDGAIRSHYGPEVKQQFKKWAADIAEGDKSASDAGDIAFNYLRQSVSVAGLGFNVVSAAMQPLGITQSIVRVGAKWVGRGVSQYLAHPIELTRQVNEMSDFMANRARTRFRELNELRNQVEGQTAVKEFVGHYAYFLMMRFQQAVDVPTWWGAYEKAVAQGNDDERAVSLADQAVIDAQGGGQTKDLAGIERTGPKGKLFTVFYSFMNTAMNLGVAQGMTEHSKAKLVADYALLYLIPPMLGYALKAAITPGDSGDDDWGKIAKKLLAAQIDYMMGMMVYVRELSDAAKTLAGANDMGRDYQGPAGLRPVVDAGKFAKQVSQGEFDDAFRKASVNLMGDLFGLPSAQINRTITGVKAIEEGKTSNPAAVVFGFQEKR